VRRSGRPLGAGRLRGSIKRFLVGGVSFSSPSLVGVCYHLIIQARPPCAFGFAFIIGYAMESGYGHYVCAAVHRRTLETTAIAMVLAIIVGLGAAISSRICCLVDYGPSLYPQSNYFPRYQVCLWLWGLCRAPWPARSIEPAIGQSSIQGSGKW